MSSLSQFAQSGKIKSIQRGIILIGAGTSSSSVTITAVNTSKSILYHLGQSTSTYSSGSNTINSDAYLVLANSTTITAFRGLSLYTQNQFISYQIVEYY